MAEMPGWEQFARELADMTWMEAEAIQPRSRLADDLGFDSLALAELGVLLEERYGGDQLVDQLETIEWKTLTAGMVFDNYIANHRQH
jgi:acyl carrier protein